MNLKPRKIKKTVMGKIKNIFTGEFTGKVGAITGYYSNGKHYVRSAYNKRKKKASPAQIQNRARFKLATTTLKPIKNLLKTSLRDYDKSQYIWGQILSHAMNVSIFGTYPKFKIDWS